jgi:hypothetical protein
MSHAAQSEIDRLRFDDADAVDAASREPLDKAAGAPSLVCKTTTCTTYPTAAMRFYCVTPQSVLGTETEGSTGTFTGTPGTFKALNLGSAIPPSGTQVLVTFVGHRWVFRYDG